MVKFEALLWPGGQEHCHIILSWEIRIEGYYGSVYLLRFHGTAVLHASIWHTRKERAKLCLEFLPLISINSRLGLIHGTTFNSWWDPDPVPRVFQFRFLIISGPAPWTWMCARIRAQAQPWFTPLTSRLAVVPVTHIQAGCPSPMCPCAGSSELPAHANPHLNWFNVFSFQVVI